MIEMIKSSFIPKADLKLKKKKGVKSGINIFLLLSLIIFFSMVIGLVGMNLWKVDIENDNKKLKAGFIEKKDLYGVETIQEFIHLNNRIEIGRKLLMNHHNILPIFTFLEQSTLTGVVIDKLKIEENENLIKVSGIGVAPTLNYLYLQANSYSENRNIENLMLSNIVRGEDGKVLFDLNFEINKKDLTVREFIK